VRKRFEELGEVPLQKKVFACSVFLSSDNGITQIYSATLAPPPDPAAMTTLHDRRYCRFDEGGIGLQPHPDLY
jgi:hypothetical protein